MRFLLKDSLGKPSVSYTMMIVSFVVVLLWLVLSIFENIGPVHIRAFSGTESMAFLGPILLLYWGRKGQQLNTNMVDLSGAGNENGDNGSKPKEEKK